MGVRAHKSRWEQAAPLSCTHLIREIAASSADTPRLFQVIILQCWPPDVSTASCEQHRAPDVSTASSEEQRALGVSTASCEEHLWGDYYRIMRAVTELRQYGR